MRIESKLCHVSESKTIVLVYGWLNDKNLGSALGEGPTVDAAEDKAISRLNKRVSPSTNNYETLKSINQSNVETPFKVELPKFL